MSEKKQVRAVTPAPPAVQPLATVDPVSAHVADIAARVPAMRYVRGEGRQRELRLARLVLDPGVDAGKRDGWSGLVTEWYLTAEEYERPEGGEVEIAPVIVLSSDTGEIVRLSGWPVVRAWARLIAVMGGEAMLAGVPIRVRRRASQTVGRSYWTISIDMDVAGRAPGQEG